MCLMEVSRLCVPHLTKVFVSQIPLPDDARPRCSHTMYVFQLAPGLVEAIIFGGVSLSKDTLSATYILRLGERTLSVAFLNLFQGV